MVLVREITEKEGCMKRFFLSSYKFELIDEEEIKTQEKKVEFHQNSANVLLVT